MMALQSAGIPVVRQPIVSQILYRLVTVSSSILFSGTLFSVITTTQSLPFNPIDVNPDVLTALNAYSMVFMILYLLDRVSLLVKI